MTLVGGLIVFATFVVKDAWREHLKETLDSAAAAGTEYLIRSDAVSVREDVQSLSVEQFLSVERITADKLTSATKHDKEWTAHYENLMIDQATHDSRLVSQTCADIWMSYQSTKQLIERTHGERLSARLTGLRKDMETLATDCSDFADTSRRRADNIRPLTSAKIAELTELDDRFTALYSKAEALLPQLQIIGAEGFVAEEQSRHELERRYRIWSWISYGLYGFGWSLALYGRLQSADQVAELA
jgi:hypothetical protein